MRGRVQFVHAARGERHLGPPPEREVAELSRRIALNLLGGHDLSVQGADNEVPTRSELGRGELPFTSIAVGFSGFRVA